MKFSANDLRLVMALVSILLTLGDASCQRPGFISGKGSSVITLTPLFSQSLNFDQLTVDSGAVRQIELGGCNDERVVVAAVDAPEDAELQVSVTTVQGDRFCHNPENNFHIPFQLLFAYSNSGFPVTHNDIRDAKMQAIKVSKGLNSVIFPANRTYCRPPEPVLLSENGEETQTRVRVYLFFYGSIGPVSSHSQVVAGHYKSDIVVNVEVVSHAEH